MQSGDFEDCGETLRHQIMTVIRDNTGGMFLLVRLYLDEVEAAARRHMMEVHETLECFQERGSNGLEHLLNLAYNNTMSRVTDQSRKPRDLALRALSWIPCAERPLKPSELMRALAVTPGIFALGPGADYKVPAVMAVCCSLITVDETCDVIRLIHHTTQEYFNQPRQGWPREAKAAFSNGHANITTVCATYLSFDTFRLPTLAYDSDDGNKKYTHDLWEW
ncbi:hypothetical protein B0T24DRAFT_43963 [Lasiosphaeria ovina]|uniref:GPI inositol-deacylase winged helix domain-containing protein n=1 Tax=Lasiosphaeria ovina TaxID=92902 RepID=A0AAE0NKP2_9PEZI|nr:hypothetical protein B0T24DRAFT_43963 [Lasiosphaeria ovina]